MDCHYRRLCGVDDSVHAQDSARQLRNGRGTYRRRHHSCQHQRYDGSRVALSHLGRSLVHLPCNVHRLHKSTALRQGARQGAENILPLRRYLRLRLCHMVRLLRRSAFHRKGEVYHREHDRSRLPVAFQRLGRYSVGNRVHQHALCLSQIRLSQPSGRYSRLDRQRRNLCYYKLPVDG